MISKIVERDVNEETYFKESSKFLFEHIPAFEFSMLINLINDGKHESLDATILSKDNDFIYISPGLHGDFDLMAYGPDGEPGGEDADADINNWEL